MKTDFSLLVSYFHCIIYASFEVKKIYFVPEILLNKCNETYFLEKYEHFFK